MTETIHVVACPAHYRIDRSVGSEYQWSAEILRALNTFNSLRLTAVTGAVVEPLDVTTVALWPAPRRLTLSRRLIFTGGCALAGWRLTDADVYHHILPFAFERTFNPLALIRRRHQAFVLGPVQERHGVDTNDERRLEFRVPGEHAPSMLMYEVLRFGAPVGRLLSRSTLRRADAIIAISEAAAKTCRASAPGVDVTVIPPGVDIDRFSPGTVVGDEVLVVSYLVRRKRVGVVIRAIAELRRRDSHRVPMLRIVGDGPARPDLEALVRDLGLADVVCFEGAVRNELLPEIYRRARCVCFLPAISVGATVPLEALASGVPLIVADPAFIEETAKGADVALLVEAEPEAVADAIARLLHDDSRHGRMRTDGRRVAEQNYGWLGVTARYVEVYRRAIAWRRSGERREPQVP